MKLVMTLAIRNLKLYFRDRMTVFYSLLSVLLIIMLYAMFLGKTIVDGMQKDFPNAEGLRFLIDSWLIAGLLAVETVTVSLAAYGIMVKDADKCILNDFRVAPIRRSQIVASYVLSSLIIAVVMTVFALLLGELYILSAGGQVLPALTLLHVLGIILATVFSSSALTFLLASFTRSQTAFGTLSTLIGTMIGFLAGIYVPMGSLPAAMQTVIKIVPASHGAAILRQIFMAPAIDQAFHGVPAQVITGFEETMGVVLKVGDKTLTEPVMLAFLLGTGVLFYVLSVLRMRGYKNK